MPMTNTQLTQEQTASLCRELALLLHAGIDTTESARLLRREDNGVTDRVLDTMEKDLAMGTALSAAAEHTGAFPAYVSALIRVGEETGRLEEALTALADYYEERLRTTRLLKNALAYPMIVFLVMLGVIGVLLVKVLPVFDRVYRSLGSRLTGVAGGMLWLGDLLRAALPALLVLLGLLALLGVLFSLCPRIRNFTVLWFQKRFGDRGMLRSFNNAKFIRALSMGMDSGLSPEASLELAEGLLDHIPAAAARVSPCRAQTGEGVSLADSLRAAGVLSPAQGRLLAAGARSGSEETVLKQLSRELTDAAEAALTRWIARAEPAMVLIASALVGLILLSAMLPLMNILTSIG